MQDIQKQFGYIPKENIVQLSKDLDMPVSELYAIATFYKALSLTPRGRHIIRVCDGTACHIRGSVTLLDAIRDILDIAPDETTADGLYSLEVVNCLGACALAPVMVIDDVWYGQMTSERLPEVLKTHPQRKEAQND